MVGNWQNSFGGKNVKPAFASYEYIALTADTDLVWPLESSEGTPSVAGVMEVVPGQAALTLSMPDATQGATGIAGIVQNTGNTSFTLLDFNSAQLGVIDVGEAWVIVLRDNGTKGGSWELLQLGATTSNAQAAALAGAGLQAVGTQLLVEIATAYLNVNTSIVSSYRATGVVWEGTSSPGTLQLDSIANLTTGWWALFSNLGTEPVTITTTGSDTINGTASITLPVGGSGAPYSVLVVAASDGFNTFAGTPSIIPISGGGTGASTAGQALINLGGSTVGIEIFEAPNAAAILALLGISASAFIESTVATDQNLTPDYINTAFVCTAALNLNLPDTTTLTNEFVIAAYAQGGIVTLVPVGTDRINGATIGTSYAIPEGSSLLLTTDAAGNWWPFFVPASSVLEVPWVVATGSSDAIVVTNATPTAATTDGVLQTFRATAANATTTPTLNVDSHGAQPIKKDGGVALNIGDIPGAGADVWVRYNSGGPYWELINPTINLDLIGSTQGDILYRDAGAWMTLAPGAAGSVLKSSGPAANPVWLPPSGTSLIGITAYSAAGSYTYTTPVGASFLVVQVVGAGGGGAGTSCTNNTDYPGGGGGGNAGANSMGQITSPSASYAVTVGAAGTGGFGAASGNPGGASSFDIVIACNGGPGGFTSATPTSSEQGALAATGAPATVSTAGNIFACAGAVAGAAIIQNRGFSLGGNGGNGPFGGAGQGAQIVGRTNSAVNGGNAGGPGSGGGGAAVYSFTGAQSANGGNGYDGYIIVWAYG